MDLEREETTKHKDANTPTLSWMSLPRKGQMMLLFLARLADFFHQSSLQSYMFHQLKSLDPTLSDSTLSWQTGILQGSFTVPQVVTSTFWGWIADKPYCGRRLVLLIGLVGTAISCIAVGYSSSFIEAVIWRALGGAINGTVGVCRTMLAENAKDKRYLPQAFLLLPLSFNIASLIGPICGGALVDFPNKTLTWSKSSNLEWLQKYPYAAPGLLNAFVLLLVSILCTIWLEETLPNCTVALNRECLNRFTAWFKLKRTVTDNGRPLETEEYDHFLDSCSDSEEDNMLEPGEKGNLAHNPPRLPFFKILTTRNVLLNFSVVGLFDFHMGAFNQLWPVLLSSPKADSEDHRSPLFFSGGLDMTPAAVGSVLAILGAIGLVLQLTLYPQIHQSLGTVKSFRIFSLLFPLAYFSAPYITFVPSTAWMALWICIVVILCLQVLARTFSLPATILLINNCAPNPLALGTIHGLGQAVSAGSRALGSISSGYWNDIGLRIGMMPLSWWAVSTIAILGWVVSLWVDDGPGSRPE